MGRALEVRTRFHVGFPLYDYSLDRMLSEYGIVVGFYRFTGRVREMLMGTRLLLRPDLSSVNRRWLKGHALGHRLLHQGNQLQMEGSRMQLKRKQEAQANAFAGYLFMGDMLWAWPGMTVAEAAAEAMVPAEELAKWCACVSDDFKLPYADPAVQLELGV